MRLFLLLFQRNLSQIIGNWHLTFLPISYLALALFLLSFLASDQNGSLVQGPFWVLMTLSTVGALSQTVARDQALGFLPALQNEYPHKMLSYVLAKVATLCVAWAVTFGVSFSLLCLFQDASGLISIGLICVCCLSVTLASLYVLLDTLLLQGRSWPLLSIVLFVPFVLPALLLMTHLCSVPTDGKGLMALLSYTFFLGAAALGMSCKSLGFDVKTRLK